MSNWSETILLTGSLRVSGHPITPVSLASCLSSSHDGSPGWVLTLSVVISDFLSKGPITTDEIFILVKTILLEECFNADGSARKGQMVDASIVAVPKRRNSREENKRINQGEIPEDWREEKKRQKDTDARWTKKNGQNHYGYKNHIDVDVKHKLIRSYEVTSASVHDSQVFETLLDEHNSSRDVWADSAYRSEEKLRELKKRKFREHLQRKGKEMILITQIPGG